MFSSIPADAGWLFIPASEKLAEKKINRQEDKKGEKKREKAEDAAKSSVIKWSRGDLDCSTGHGVLEPGAAPQRSMFVALMVQMSKHCVTKGNPSWRVSDGV